MQFAKSSLSRFGTLLVIVLFLSGCSDSDDEQGSVGGSSGTVIATDGTSATVVTSDLNSYITAAINDEYKARNTYQAVIDKFGNVRPFVNIKRSEEQHIRQLIGLYNTYGISVPSDSVGGIAAPASVSAACSIGVQAEIANADMYNSLLAGTTAYSDVQAVFKQLQAASLDQHLPAFQRCAD